MNENSDVLKIIESGLLGFATGDALGVPVEFTLRSLRKSDPVCEMRGNGSYPVPEGTWSDDTSMTIATMDSIHDSDGINYEDIMDKYCDWVFHHKYCANDQVFDVGTTIGKAIDHYYKNHMKVIECGGREEMDNGNGSLMRMLPIVYYLYYSELDEDTKTNIIQNYSSLTHGHEVSLMGCHIYYDFMSSLLSGLSKEDAYRDLQYNDYSKHYSEDCISRYKRVLSGELSSLEEDSIKSTGYVVDTLEAAIWCVLHYHSYRDSVMAAVNLGDDTDTIAAITGSMVGTIYGMESIPEEWLSKVRKVEELKSIATGFCRVVCDNNTDVSDRFYDSEII